jgi:hypothetical protein
VIKPDPAQVSPALREAFNACARQAQADGLSPYVFSAIVLWEVCGFMELLSAGEIPAMRLFADLSGRLVQTTAECRAEAEANRGKPN